MALGFIKRVFSFGKKQVEETPPPAVPATSPLQGEEKAAAVFPPLPGEGPDEDRGWVSNRATLPAETPSLAPSSRGLSPGPKDAPDLGPGDKYGDIVRQDARVGEADGLDQGVTAFEALPADVQAEFTPTPDPSPLRGGVGGGGMVAKDAAPPIEAPSPAPSSRGLSPGPKDAPDLDPGDKPRDDVRQHRSVVDADGSDEAARASEAQPANVQAEITPTPDPPPQEGGEPPAPQPPSPLRGGVGGGGNEASDASVAAPALAATDPSGEAPSPVLRTTSPLQGEAPSRPSRVTIGDAPKVQAVAQTPSQPQGWFAKLRAGLSRSSKQLSDNISAVFTKRKLDEDTLQDLEDVLIQADLGLETAMRVTDALSSGRYGRDVGGEEVKAIMATEIAKVLEPVAQPLELDLAFRPHVILVVGVNGTGKTTTIGKLAAKLRAAGLSVTLAAGDTFRAAAIEQLKIWGERTGSAVVATKLGADAAGLAFEAYEKAVENGSDVLIIDTAGRLQNKTELMDELAKIVRVLGRKDADAPHTVLQTLDATTGQNALQQVEIFRNVAGVNGLVMTKLDGTARGGILVAIAAKYKLPVYFAGVGEGVDDLEPFRAADFARAIAGTG